MQNHVTHPRLCTNLGVHLNIIFPANEHSMYGIIESISGFMNGSTSNFRETAKMAGTVKESFSWLNSPRRTRRRRGVCEFVPRALRDLRGYLSRFPFSLIFGSSCHAPSGVWLRPGRVATMLPAYTNHPG